MLFLATAAQYLTFDENEEPYQRLAMALIVFPFIFILLEVKQIKSFWSTGALGFYLTDVWNYLDWIAIVLVLVTSFMLIFRPAGEVPNGMLIATGLFIFLDLVSFLKKMFLPFAIFVSGVLQVR